MAMLFKVTHKNTLVDFEFQKKKCILSASDVAILNNAVLVSSVPSLHRLSLSAPPIILRLAAVMALLCPNMRRIGTIIITLSKNTISE